LSALDNDLVKGLTIMSNKNETGKVLGAALILSAMAIFIVYNIIDKGIVIG
jgi:hypothetical protein